jgi:hypothetical protein
MAKLIFRLRNVPDDEAEDVRQLFEDHDIGVYETDAGNWGISLPAIWLEDDSQFEQAKTLLDNYQRARAIRMREQYEELRRQGLQTSMFSVLKEQPLRSIIYLLAIGVILYLSIGSFYGF